MSFFGGKVFLEDKPEVQQDGSLLCFFVFMNTEETNKVRNQVRISGSTIDQIKRQIQNAQQVLDNNNTAATDYLIPGELDVTIAEVPPTDLQLFQKAYLSYLSGKGKIDSGLLKPDDPDVAALLASAQKLYKPEFAGL